MYEAWNDWRRVRSEKANWGEGTQQKGQWFIPREEQPRHGVGTEGLGLVGTERAMRWSSTLHKDAEGVGVFVESQEERRLVRAEKHQVGAQMR